MSEVSSLRSDSRTTTSGPRVSSRTKRPTMRDVAKDAGVSIKTVSRVVNKEAGVRDELATRVQSSLDRLGYRMDQRARSLRKNHRPSTIGFVLVDVSNPFFGSLLRGIEDVARERDCVVLSGSTDLSVQRERALIESFIDRRVDGLIVVPSAATGEVLRTEMDRGTPVAFVDLEPSDGEYDIVRSDHLLGASTATRHLLSHGHRDIAYFGDDQQIQSSQLRLQGFRETMASAGIDVPDNRIVTGRYSPERWEVLVGECLDAGPRPTAVFSAQNIASVGAVRALHARGLQDVIAQVGFDDLELARAVQPALTVVPQFPRELGRQAAELLFARIDGEDGPPVQAIAATSIVVRGSGEIAPTAD